MGLLDFISKSSAPQGAQSDPASDPSQQGGQFSDIQYPIPAGTQPADDGTMPVYPQTQTSYSQYTYDPSTTNAINQDEVADITQTDNANMYNQNFQEVEDLTQYGSQQIPAPVMQDVQPLPQLTDSVTPTQFDSGNQYPVNQDQVLTPTVPIQPEQPIQQYVPETQDVSQDVTPVQETPSQETQSQETQSQPVVTNPFNPNANQIENVLPPIESLEAQSQTQDVQPVPAIDDVIVPPVVDTPVAPTQNVENANLSGYTNDNLGDFDINNLVSDAPSTQPSAFPTPIVENTPVVAPENGMEVGDNSSNTATMVSEQSTPSVPVEELKNEEKPMNTSDYELVINDTPQENPQPEEPVQPEVEETKEEVLAPTVVVPVEIEKDDVAEVKKDDITKAIEENPVTNSGEFKVIRNVAFLGLNSKTFKNVSTEVESLVGKLVAADLYLLVDSTKGYGEDVVRSIEASASKSKLTSVYFKPFYSTYTDEADKKTTLADVTTVIYSDIIERTKYFIRESEAFIFPETSGLVNFGLLNLLLSIQFLYAGQHKPVILLGNRWADKLNQMKALGGFSEEEVNSIKVASNADEALKILREEDTLLSKDQSLRNRKFFDYREDFDEYEYMN